MHTSLIVDRTFSGIELRATPENPTFDLNDPEAWNEWLEGSESDSGIKVNQKKALSIAAVNQAVQMISGDIAGLPLDLYRRSGDDEDGREKDKQHPAFRLVRRRPNREQPAQKFWRSLIAQRLLWSNSYAYVVRDGAGRPRELLPLLPDRTGVLRKQGRLWCVTELSRGPDGADKGPWLQPLPYDDVLHFAGLSMTGIEGHDFIKAARDSIGRALAAGRFTSRFFKNGAKAGGILMIPKENSKQARDRIEEGFKRYEGADNWFKTMVLRDGAKFENTFINPQQGQMTETREEEVREVARWFNLNPARLGVAGSVSYNSMTESNRQYLDSTLAPILDEITAECEAKLLTPAEQEADTYYFEHNTKKLLRMNPLERHQVYAIGLRNGLYNPDECRKAENLPPRADGQGGKYMPMQGAPKPGSSDGGADKLPADPTNPQEPAKDTLAGSGDTSGQDGEPKAEGGRRKAEHARRRVIFNLGQRARHKAKNPRAFLEWIDGGLAAHRTEARELCGDNAAADLIDPLLAELRTIAETTHADELYRAVDAAVSRRELAAAD